MKISSKTIAFVHGFYKRWKQDELEITGSLRGLLEPFGQYFLFHAPGIPAAKENADYDPVDYETVHGAVGEAKAFMMACCFAEKYNLADQNVRKEYCIPILCDDYPRVAYFYVISNQPTISKAEWDKMFPNRLSPREKYLTKDQKDELRKTFEDHGYQVVDSARGISCIDGERIADSQ